MDGFDFFLQLPITAQAAVVCFVACATTLFVILPGRAAAELLLLALAPGNKIPSSAGVTGAAHSVAHRALWLFPALPWN